MPDPAPPPPGAGARRVRFALLAALALLLPLAGLWAASQAPPVRRAAHRQAEALLRAALRRDIRIQDIRLRPWVATLDLHGVQADQPSPTSPALAAEVVRIRWSWGALLDRHLLLRSVTLIRPDVSLAPAGRLDASPEALLALPPRRPSVRTYAGWTVSLEAVSVEQGRLRWSARDGTAGLAQGLRGQIRWADHPSPAARVALEAERLDVPLGGRAWSLRGLQLAGDWQAESLAIREARAEAAGFQLALRGHIRNPAARPTLDLDVEAVLPRAGWAGGTPAPASPRSSSVQLAGRIQGDLLAPGFSGEARWPLAGGQAPPTRLTAAWADGRLRAEAIVAPAGTAPVRLQADLVLASRAFTAQLHAAGADLAAFHGMPAALAAHLGLTLPEALRGLLTADLTVWGTGADLSTLRGGGTLQAEGLGVPGELPQGRLEARLRATAALLALETFHLSLPAGQVRGSGAFEMAGKRFRLPVSAEIWDAGEFGRGFGLRQLGGRGSFAGELAGTPDAPGLRGRLHWREARAGRHAADLVEGDVEVEPRRLASPRLLVRRGRTTAILRGSVSALGRKPLRALDPGQELALDLAGEVPAGHTADLAGDLPPGLEVQGAFRAQGTLSGTPRRLAGRIEVAMEDVQTWRDRWDRAQAVVGLDADGVHVTAISARRPGEQATGEVHVQGDELRGHVETDGVDLSRVGWLRTASLAGRAAGRLKLSGTTKALRVQGQAASPDLAYRGIRFGAARADFAIVGRRSLEVQATAEGLRLLLGMDLVQDTLTADLAATEADLLPLLRLAGAAVEGIAVQGTGRIVLQGPLDDVGAGQGQLDFPRLRLVANGDAWENRAAVRAAWRNQVLTLPPTRLRSGARELLLQGTLGEGQQADLAVRGDFPLAAVAGLLGGLQPRAGAARADLTVRGPLRAPEIRGQATVHGATLLVPGLQSPLEEVNAAVTLDGARTGITSWHGRLAAGVIRGSGEVVRGPDGWRMATTFALDNGRAEQLLGPLRGKGEVTGRLSATGSLRSRGADREAFWRSLSGDVKVEMREGRMGQHTVLARILSLLNVAQLLSLKIPDLVSSGMPYEQLTADIGIRDGVARTENLVLDAPAMKVNAVGEVNLPAQTVDLQVAVKPFQTVDSIITKIPIAGWLLGGKEKSLILATFHVTGPLTEPEVTAMPVKDVARNVFGIFRRILELPEAFVGAYENLPPQPIRPPEGQDR